MAVEVASCILKELRDPKKATADYLSSEDGKFSWGRTTDEEHEASLGRYATNDPAESPFALLTRQLQSFGRVLGIHASAVGQARMNEDFKRSKQCDEDDGLFHRLPKEMHDSLLTFALSVAPKVRESEEKALARQREAKKKKQDALRARKLQAVQKNTQGR